VSSSRYPLSATSSLKGYRPFLCDLGRSDTRGKGKGLVEMGRGNAESKPQGVGAGSAFRNARDELVDEQGHGGEAAEDEP
jgi:hypothetical protein